MHFNCRGNNDVSGRGSYGDRGGRSEQNSGRHYHHDDRHRRKRYTFNLLTLTEVSELFEYSLQDTVISLHRRDIRDGPAHAIAVTVAVVNGAIPAAAVGVVIKGAEAEAEAESVNSKADWR